jgi:predicted metal-dependent RNase
VLRLGVKVISISGAKGKKIIEAQQWKSQPYRRARAERSTIESLVFTLKENFEFAEMMRRTHENVMAEMLVASVHKYLRIRDLCKELAFGSGKVAISYNSFESNVLCHQFLRRESASLQYLSDHPGAEEAFRGREMERPAA